MVSRYGGMVEVHVSTPLQVCEARDRKGLYAAARRGDLKALTGVSDPYDVPENPELAIDTSEIRLEQAIDSIINHLRTEGYLEGHAIHRPGRSSDLPRLMRASEQYRLPRRDRLPVF